MPVGRDFLTGLQDDDIAHDHLFSRHLADAPVADDFHQDVIVHRVQDLERLVGFHLEEEAHAAGEHDGEENADWLQEGREAFRLRSPAMYAGDDHRQEPCH